MRFKRPRPLTTRPSVSVVVPCYNYGHFLPDAVASAFDGNEDVDVDVIVVDDCSPDGSVEVARGIASRNDRVRVIEHPFNQGHIATYNDGLRRARGDYVVLLSADDLLTPGSLSRSAALMEHEPDVGLVYGYPVSFTGSPDEVALGSARRIAWTVWEGEDWLRRVCVRGRNIIVNPEAMMRRALLDEIGWYDAAHPHAGDLLMWMHAAARGGVGRVNGPVQALYRQHGANMSSTTFAGVLTNLRESRRAFDAFFADVQLPPRQAASDEARARRALAREAMLQARLAQAAEDAVDPREHHALLEFARDCWPAIEGSRQWRRHESRARSGALSRLAVRYAHDVRWQVRWQRWRVLGT
jgi:glycosyl transferase family 2